MSEKLAQETVNKGCADARERYMAMPINAAKKQFSYELQGFLASMNDRKEWPLVVGMRKVIELIDITARENGI